MKLKNKKIVASAAVLLAGSILTPTILSSCSVVYEVKTKVLSKESWSIDKYSNLQTSKVSLEDAVYGSNFNNGNYLFVYGTTFDSSFRKFLYGQEEDTVEEQDFSKSQFFQKFYGANGLGTTERLTFSVSILLFIDIPPYFGDAGIANSKDGRDDPMTTYTDQEILDQYNAKEGQDGKYTTETLPNEAKYKIGLYKRYDKSAKRYREFIKYLKDIRPDGSFSDSSGMIAFKKDTKPKSYATTDSEYDNLVKFYSDTETE